MDKREKILYLLFFTALSILLRTVSEPYLGAYLDKTGLYLTAYFLGLYWCVFASILIVFIYMVLFGEILALFKLPVYLILAFIVGGTTDIIMRRRSVESELIEIYWFINFAFIGYVLAMVYSTYSIALFTIFVLLGLIFTLSYWGRFQAISSFLRSRIGLGLLFVLTPLTYMLLEFGFYAGLMFNFFSFDVIIYADIYRASLSCGGDGLLSLVLFLLILAIIGEIKNYKFISKLPKSKIKLSIIFLLITFLLLVPTSINYQYREKALVVILPQDTDPWMLTIVKMDYVWLPIGAHGTNYYYLVPGERSNPNSKYYQAWFGIYWVNGKWYSESDISKVKDYIYKFAIIDQNFWLAEHGDPNPYTSVKSEEEFIKHSVIGVEGWLMIGSMYTHSDVASENYRDISIKGFFFATYFPELDKTAIVYACTFEQYYNDNYLGIRDELFSLLNSLEFSFIYRG